MTQAEMRRIIYGDERKPGTGKNPFAVKDKREARKLLIEAEERRVELEAENRPGMFDDIVQDAIRKRKKNR